MSKTADDILNIIQQRRDRRQQVRYSRMIATQHLLENYRRSDLSDIKIGDTVYVLLRKRETAEVVSAGKPDMVSEEGMVALMLADKNVVIDGDSVNRNFAINVR